MSKHFQQLFHLQQQHTPKAMNNIIIGIDIDQYVQLQATGHYDQHSFAEFKELVFKNRTMFNDLCFSRFMESDTAFIIQLETTIKSAQQGWDDRARYWLKEMDDYRAKLLAQGCITDDCILKSHDARHLIFSNERNSFPRFLHDKVLRRLVVSKTLDFKTYEKRIHVLEKLGLASIHKWQKKFQLKQFKAIADKPYYNAL